MGGCKGGRDIEYLNMAVYNNPVIRISLDNRKPPFEFALERRPINVQDQAVNGAMVLLVRMSE